MFLQGNDFVFVLDELLLDILKHSSHISVDAMEKSVLHRTGLEFSTLHDKVSEMEFGSHGIEDFIENDSRLLRVQDSIVQARYTLSPPKWRDGETQVLDLSNRHITSCQLLVDECVKARNASYAVLRESTFSEFVTEWPFGILDLLFWFCPRLSQIDITGCVGFSRDIFSNITDQSKEKIIDYLDPLYILNFSNVGQQIREMVEGKLLSPSTSCMGWSLLHSAILRGDAKLVEQMLQCNDDGFNSIESDLLQTSLELATALHRLEIVKQLRCENAISVDPSRLVELLLLPQHGIESFEHPIEALTSNETAWRAVRDLHDLGQCNLIPLLNEFCEKGDINYKKKVLEEIFQKIQACTGPECHLLLPCWNEHSFRDIVQILMDETGCSAEGKIGNCPYLMYALPSTTLVELLLQKGAKIDDKDQSGYTALFYALEKAVISPSPQCPIWNQAIKFLLDKKANPNTRSYAGETPLLHSLSYIVALSSPGDVFEADRIVEVWRLLLNAGATAKTRDEMDRPLLHLLLSKFVENKHCQPGGCLALIQKGLPVLQHYDFAVNTRDASGNTPLHKWASLPNKVICDEVLEIGKEIISHGGAVNARNDKEKTPLHLSQSWRQVDVLVSQGAQVNAQDLNGDTPLHKFIGKHPLIGDQVKQGRWRKCLAAGMNPFCFNNDKNCPICTLLERKLFKSANSLLKAIFENQQNKVLSEAALCFKDRKGNSLLHIVITMENEGAQSVLNYLLEKGCNVNLQNAQQETPLHMVCKRAKDTNHVPPESVENSIILLLKYHANVFLPDGQGNTCDTMLVGNERLHKLLHEDIDKVSIPDKLKWSSESLKHKAVLTEVARGSKSKKVGHFYHHENHIGKGSFAVVFPAINEEDGREAAMKRLENVRLEGKGAEIDREVKLLLKLSGCPFVVNYFSCVSDSDFKYVVMELMEGSLDTFPISGEKCENVYTICSNIASGLEYLHANDVLHRDLKPQNILYKRRPNFVVKISDFGLSKILHAGTSSTQSETVMHTNAGTRCWMAPELLKKKPKNHSKASDVFSCGLLFHYILARKHHPFGSCSGDSNNHHETEENIRNNRLSLCSTLTPEAKQLLTNMLLRKVRRRPTAASLQNFPFFWDDRKKVCFLTAVGNQKEFEMPRSYLQRSLTPVERNLETACKTEGCIDWISQIQKLHAAAVSVYPHRLYDKRSTVELVRFIRNLYNHHYDLPPVFTDLLFQDFVFLERFPFLVAAVYDSVKACDSWKAREDLNNFFL